MSFLCAFWRDSLRLQFTSLRTWALLVLLPLLSFGAAGLMPVQEVSAPVQVGVVLPKEGGEGFWQRLEERSGLVVVFHTAQADQATRQVAAGRWDCALILPEDFQSRLDRRDLEGLFTLLTGPGSAVYPLVRETVSACVAECVSPGMAEDYLLDSKIVSEEDIEAVRPRLNQVLLDQDRVQISLETVGGVPLDPLTLADSGVSNLLIGLTAILLLIWVLFTAMDLGRWLTSPLARRLVALRGESALLLARLGAALVPALLAGAMALLAVERPLASTLALIPYLLVWGAAARVLGRRRPRWGPLPGLMPFIPVLGLILSPVLVDVSVLFPALGPAVRWMPITLYLKTCGGSWRDGLVLAAAGAALLTLALLPSGKKRAG